MRWPKVLKIKRNRCSCLIKNRSSHIDGIRYLLGSPMIFKILYYLGPGSLIAIAARNDSNTVSNWIETKVVLNKNCSEKMSPLVIHSHPQEGECCRVIVFVPAHFSLRFRATVLITQELKLVEFSTDTGPLIWTTQMSTTHNFAKIKSRLKKTRARIQPRATKKRNFESAKKAMTSTHNPDTCAILLYKKG